MYYKLYIDSVFILQMTTDLYLLSLAGQIMRRTATRRRIWLGAAAGAGLSCVSLMIPVFTVGARLLLGSVPVSMCMMCLTYQIHGVRSLLRASLLMAAAGFFFGGGMIWILNRLRAVMKGGRRSFLNPGGRCFVLSASGSRFTAAHETAGGQPADRARLRAGLGTGNPCKGAGGYGEPSHGSHKRRAGERNQQKNCPLYGVLFVSGKVSCDSVQECGKKERDSLWLRAAGTFD